MTAAAPSETSKQSPPRHTALLSLESLGLLPDKHKRDVTPGPAQKQAHTHRVTMHRYPWGSLLTGARCPLHGLDTQTELPYMWDPGDSPASIQGLRELWHNSVLQHKPQLPKHDSSAAWLLSGLWPGAGDKAASSCSQTSSSISHLLLRHRAPRAAPVWPSGPPSIPALAPAGLAGDPLQPFWLRCWSLTCMVEPLASGRLHIHLLQNRDYASVPAHVSRGCDTRPALCSCSTGHSPYCSCVPSAPWPQRWFPPFHSQVCFLLSNLSAGPSWSCSNSFVQIEETWGKGTSLATSTWSMKTASTWNLRLGSFHL